MAELGVRMKRRAIWRVSVATTAEAEEPVGNLLTEIFGGPAATHCDVLKGTTRVSVFLDEAPAELAARRAVLRARCRELSRWGLDAGSARIRVCRLPPENWAESWKRHFKPIELGGALLIQPSWSRRKPRPGQVSVVLDPGLSFGTGQHATTWFCLRELVARRKPGVKQAFLDVGTGSGILAIAAAKLGYAPVHAFDFDPEAVRVARGNARRNRVAGSLRIRRQDVTELPAKAGRRYDLVCANLLSTLLIAERGGLAGLLRPGGVLVLAGILKGEFAQVRSAYEGVGLRSLRSRGEREWRSGTFSPRPPIRQGQGRAAEHSGAGRRVAKK